MAKCVSTMDKHHSKDTVKVFHGKIEPRVLCGFHAMREGFTS